MIQVIFRKTLCGRKFTSQREIDVRANWDVEQVLMSAFLIQNRKENGKKQQGF
jgi:hypothetical protein